MGLVHDTGFDPAYDHEGLPVAVDGHGAELGDLSRLDRDEHTVGWRAGCECGWRSPTTHARAEWPSASGLAPDELDDELSFPR